MLRARCALQTHLTSGDDSSGENIGHQVTGVIANTITIGESAPGGVDSPLPIQQEDVARAVASVR